MYYIAKFKKKPSKDLLRAKALNAKIADFFECNVLLKGYLRRKRTLKNTINHYFITCIPERKIHSIKHSISLVYFTSCFALYSTSITLAVRKIKIIRAKPNVPAKALALQAKRGPY